jgi:hypothetical protein
VKMDCPPALSTRQATVRVTAPRRPSFKSRGTTAMRRSLSPALWVPLALCLPPVRTRRACACMCGPAARSSPDGVEGMARLQAQ